MNHLGSAILFLACVIGLVLWAVGEVAWVIFIIVLIVVYGAALRVLSSASALRTGFAAWRAHRAEYA